jgi:HupE / UreJ protein
VSAAAQCWHRAALAGLALCGALLATAPAQAHLMAAQKGTLNIVGDAAFLVLSVPVSALQGVDDDGDGALSLAELRAHTDAIRAQVHAGVQLHDPAGALPLQVMMLDVAPPESTPQAAASHLTVMGRFQLRPPAVPSDTSQLAAVLPLSLTFALFGKSAGEQQQDLTITRHPDTQWLRFVPAHPTHALLPAAWAVLAEYVRTGAEHVLSGPDHLLFLLVVLAAGWGWRSLLGALTCFTAGHALTLLACAWGGWSAPTAWVEPAIAATIVGLAAFDHWTRRRARPLHTGVRLSLVFACALVHGLGLAGALAELTRWAPGSAQLAWALVGFNLGVEAAQIAVAALTGLLVLGVGSALKGWIPPMATPRVGAFASAAAMVAGSFWFVERVALST